MSGLEKSSSGCDFLCKVIALVPTVSVAAYLPLFSDPDDPRTSPGQFPTTPQQDAVLNDLEKCTLDFIPVHTCPDEMIQIAG